MFIVGSISIKKERDPMYLYYLVNAFKKSLKGLSDFQKLILLTIAVVLPAGIFIAVALAAILRRKK